MFLQKFSTPLPQLSGKSFWFHNLRFGFLDYNASYFEQFLRYSVKHQKWSLGSRLHSLPNAFRDFSIQRRKWMADFPKNYSQRYKVPKLFFRSSKRPHRPVAGKIHQKPSSPIKWYGSNSLTVSFSQDTDPSRRPGAGSEGYAALKKHPFFMGVDWKNLRSQTPPKLAPDPAVCLLMYFGIMMPFIIINVLLVYWSIFLYLMQSQTASPERDDGHGSPWNLTHIGDSSATQNEGHGAPSTSSESSGSITRLASIDSFDSRWWGHLSFIFSLCFPGNNPV